MKQDSLNQYDVKLYHYTSINTLEKILENKTLRFTNIDNLNDSSEYKYGVNLLKLKVLQYEKEHNIFPTINLEKFDYFMFSGKLYSASFTENGDDLNFWNSYYVDKNNSVSIGFSKDKLTKCKFITNKCVYGDPYPKMDDATYLWFKKLFDNVMLIHKDKNYILITYQTAFIKQKCFESEREWRSISFPVGIISTFERHGKKCKYFDKNIDLESIEEIIIGPGGNQEENYNKVYNLLKNKNLKVELIKTKIPLVL
jgi:hypothetical protein